MGRESKNQLEPSKKPRTYRSMIYPSIETLKSSSCPSYGMRSCSTPRPQTQIDHTIPQLVPMCQCSHHEGTQGAGAYMHHHRPGRYVGWACIILFGATHIGTKWHCMCHIPNRLCHMALLSAISSGWQQICQSSQTNGAICGKYLITKYKINHTPDEPMLFVMIKACLQLKIIL